MSADEESEINTDVPSEKMRNDDLPKILFKQTDNSIVYLIKGEWNKNTISDVEDEIAQLESEIIASPTIETIIIDLNKSGKIDTSGAFLISKIIETAKNHEREAKIVCNDESLLNLFNKINSYHWNYTFDSVRYTGLALFGKKVYETWNRFYNELVSSLNFMGHTILCFWKAVLNPGHIRWVPTFAIAESAGLNAIPIVCVLTFFIGAVISFMGAQTLNNFGASIFTVDLLGVSVLREFAVLITAIILAGRSDSAFTAQIGSMKMTQEIDAMETMGINPMEMLVIPRVIALLIMTPILVLFAIFSGIAGGALVAIFSLDLSPTMFMSRLQAVGATHFWVGMVKAPVFAFIIAIIGCRQGMMVENDVISLGKNTTAAVVQAIFMVIVVDAIFAMIYNELDI
jgi:phospholipid/cholesterol/gamma-HCH transport system permease protein